VGARHDLLLARFSSDGQLDASFGSGGLLTTTVESHSAAFALLQEPDGMLVVAGSSDPAPVNNQMGTTFLARYDADGRVDTSFGTEGTVVIGPGGVPGGAVAGALLQQPDGKLVVSVPSVPPRVVRVLPDGRLDATFGTGGTVATPRGTSATSLVLQPDGKLVVAGTSDPAPPNNFMPTAFLVRYRADGRVDTSFGTGGTATVAGVASSGRGLVLQPNGKLVVAGDHLHTSFPPLVDILLSRFQPDGRLDGTFGARGTASITVGGSSAFDTLLQQSDGRLVMASTHSPGPPATIFGSTNILLARYQALGCPSADPDPCLASLATFVTEVYQAAFARQPDAGEEAYWVDVLATAPAPDTVRGMLHAVFESSEFRQRPLNPWQYVEALYLAMLGREPASAEIDLCVQAVLDRVNTLLPGFVDSPEFQSLVPSCHDQVAVTRLVERLYQYALGRGGNPAGWTQAIITWCAVEEGVEDFLNSLEYLAEPRTLADHVTVLYRALLAREPEARGLAKGVEYLAGQLADFEAGIMANPEFEAHAYRLFP
jgi:uncharacterized delta-60 repeat protein